MYNADGVFDIGYTLKYAKLGIYKAIREGKRQKIMSTYCGELIKLNPEMKYEYFHNFCMKINLDKCKPILESYEMSEIIKYAWKNKNQKSFNNKKIRFLYNPELNISKTEKAKITNQILGNEKSEKSINKIKKAIEGWDEKKDGKMTKKAVAKKTGLNRNTVAKYYDEIISKIKMDDSQKPKIKTIGTNLDLSA